MSARSPPPEGSPFDHSTILYRSGLSDPAPPSKLNLPNVVTGGANGGTPMANGFMYLLDFMDVHPESIGDSNGKLTHLTDFAG